MGKAEENKQEKKRNLIDAASDLFVTKGFPGTSIDDIARRAGVGKGTFYLYFKDKYDILNRVALNVSGRMLWDAYQRMREHPGPCLADNLIAIVDDLIDRFSKSPHLLRLVQRNFSWALVKEQLDGGAQNQLAQLLDECCAAPEMAGRSREQVFQQLFLVIELSTSIAHTSILYGQPDGIAAMKPVLYQAIRKLLG